MKKIIIALMILVISCICLPEVNAAEKYRLYNGAFYEVDEGVKFTLYVKTSKAVKWSCNDTNIATINKKGKVTAKNAGEAIITAKYGTKEVTCTIIVKDPNAELKAKLAERDYIESLKDDKIDTEGPGIEQIENQDIADLQEVIDKILEEGTSTGK